MVDHSFLGQCYLQHLTDVDLALLAGAGAPEGVVGGIRARPELVGELLERPEVAAAVFAPGGDRRDMLPASPFCVFAVAVHATMAELAGATHVREWLGPRHRAPVFDVAGLREFLADPWRRLFLAELLASFTRVASGSVVVRTRRGLRRQRFSELDPVRLAGLLDVVADAERPGVYRRLGDLALFLTGVFPDHTAVHGFSPVEEGRLLRAGRLRPEHQTSGTVSVPGFGDPGSVELLERLGRRWYRLAYELVPAPLPASLRVLGELDERFGDARRILNVLTDRYLFPFRSQWFALGA